MCEIVRVSVLRLERAVEHEEVLVLELGRALDRVLSLDVGADGAGLVSRCSRGGAERAGTVPLTSFNMPPPTSRLYFTSAMSAQRRWCRNPS